jgi:hemerythrin-like domain-containing protein
MATVTVHKNLPGFQSPAAGFEAPFEMLEACHERVHRMLALLLRLQAHVQVTGCDTQAQQAAQDVMRYFDLAAPTHHQDEELHVFPPLLAGGDVAVVGVVQQLMAQHRAMELAWTGMRQVLMPIAAHASSATAPALSSVPYAAFSVEAVQTFTALYEAHIRTEEGVAYPAAKQLLTAEHLLHIGEDMMVRRGVPARYKAQGLTPVPVSVPTVSKTEVE